MTPKALHGASTDKIFTAERAADAEILSTGLTPVKYEHQQHFTGQAGSTGFSLKHGLWFKECSTKQAFSATP
jgi:hypothetical protein